MSAPPETITAESPPPPVVTFTAPAEPRAWSAILPTLWPVLAALGAILIHLLPNRQTLTVDYYPRVAVALLLLAALFPLAHLFVRSLRPLVKHNGPLVAVAIMVLVTWDFVTLKMNWLPAVYFPAPSRVIQVYATEWRELSRHLIYSFANLISGYLVGMFVGLTCGVMVGWSPRIRYWGMPFLKLVGPIPATAWIPLALIFMPTAFYARVSLIAMAVWFPVTMLTASGISNVRVTFFDVARTMGAGKWFLIFRIAIPAALPSIFVGLFMGLCASFLTLIAAEAVGSQGGLGYYISWAKDNYEYAKVDAVFIIMAVFFSLIMSGLFKLRDWVLVWQKGTIKW